MPPLMLLTKYICRNIPPVLYSIFHLENWFRCISCTLFICATLNSSKKNLNIRLEMVVLSFIKAYTVVPHSLLWKWQFFHNTIQAFIKTACGLYAARIHIRPGMLMLEHLDNVENIARALDIWSDAQRILLDALLVLPTWTSIEHAPAPTSL